MAWAERSLSATAPSWDAKAKPPPPRRLSVGLRLQLLHLEPTRGPPEPAGLPPGKSKGAPPACGRPSSCPQSGLGRCVSSVVTCSFTLSLLRKEQPGQGDPPVTLPLCGLSLSLQVSNSCPLFSSFHFLLMFPCNLYPLSFH